ncbi:hypothetical protein C8T65DRAFT_25996 [Cerioporus squamosus]|nr:hypothetical protein C8T65DRAFT_25996 [Cerioporus squamosus]
MQHWRPGRGPRACGRWRSQGATGTRTSTMTREDITDRSLGGCSEAVELRRASGRRPVGIPMLSAVRVVVSYVLYSVTVHVQTLAGHNRCGLNAMESESPGVAQGSRMWDEARRGGWFSVLPAWNYAPPDRMQSVIDYVRPPLEARSCLLKSCSDHDCNSLRGPQTSQELG